MSDSSRVIDILLSSRAAELQNYLGEFPPEVVAAVLRESAGASERSSRVFSLLVSYNMAHGSSKVHSPDLHGRMFMFAAAAAPVIAAIWEPTGESLARLVAGRENREVSEAVEMDAFIATFHRNALFSATVQQRELPIDDFVDYARGFSFVRVLSQKLSAPRLEESHGIWIGQNVDGLIRNAELIRSRDDYSREFLEPLAAHDITNAVSEGVL